MKIQMYNLLYDKKYKNTGILTENTYSKWCKDTFKTSDYYNCAVYTSASGMLSSQNELNKLNIKTSASGRIDMGISVDDTVEEKPQDVEVNPYL